MEQFLKWKCDWARMLDGFLGVISYSFIHTTFGLNEARNLARWRSKRDGFIK